MSLSGWGRSDVSGRRALILNMLGVEFTFGENGVKDRVVKRLIDAGYDAMEDPNDTTTDFPVIMFNSTSNTKQRKTYQLGINAVNEVLSKGIPKDLSEEKIERIKKGQIIYPREEAYLPKTLQSKEYRKRYGKYGL